MNSPKRLFLLALLPAVLWGGSSDRPNVLFISVDDLKPVLSSYGDPIAKTPNFDRLAEMGVTFTNAHAQQAVCGPSRASLLTGLRPDRTQVWDLSTKIRSVNPEVITLPQYFKDNGYETLGIGKIFDARSVQGPAEDDPISWSRPYLQDPGNPDEALGYINPQIVSEVRQIFPDPPASYGEELARRKAIGGVPAFEGTYDVPDEGYGDGRIAAIAAGLIEELSATDQPFFLGVGFNKPHLPFNAPKKYWDLYSASDFELAKISSLPEGAPSYHFQPSWEIRNGHYLDIPPQSSPQTIDSEMAQTLIHGYYACVSYVDAQLGKLLDALEESGELENTIIVLWGDHGYHFGDHGMWCKHTNYEQATRTVLMIAEPGNPAVAQSELYTHPVELVDLYRTIADLAQLPQPVDIDGMSLVPVLENPETRAKDYAVSQFHRKYPGGDRIMGYAWRSDRYRYIEWIDLRYTEGDRTGAVLDRELYDYQEDPLESRNLADDPAYAVALAQMQDLAADYKAKQGLVTP
tara:strand:+ start:11449 stop:13005 length:1557 start_codon:yes stop_codon:yes gene_type:complete